MDTSKQVPSPHLPVWAYVKCLWSSIWDLAGRHLFRIYQLRVIRRVYHFMGGAV
jgi:hypothetical protein